MSTIATFARLALAGILSFSAFNCTSNSLYSDDVQAINKIRGIVELNDGADVEGVFVWFKIFNISTQCDENGEFDLKIPNPANQSGGGLDGIYQIYFYMANYRIDSVGVILDKGQIKLAGADSDKDGMLDSPILLDNILRIEAQIGNPLVLIPQRDKQTVGFKLSAPTGRVNVILTRSNPISQGDPQFLSGVIGDKNKNLCVEIFRRGRQQGNSNLEVGASWVDIYPMEILAATGDLQVGDFEVRPAITVEQAGLPAGLLLALKDAAGADACDAAFEMPMAVWNNTFSVRR